MTPTRKRAPEFKAFLVNIEPIPGEDVMTADPNPDSPRTAISNPPIQPMPANLGAGDADQRPAMPDSSRRRRAN